MRTIPWLGPINYPVAAAKRSFTLTLGKMLQTSPSSTADVEVPYFKSASVQWGGVQATSDVHMWATPAERRDLAVRPGDLLICEGGDAGRAALYEGPDGFIFQNSVHRARPIGRSEIRYFKYVMRALHGSGWLDVLCNKATIRHLTGDKLGSLQIPIPPPDEQRRIADFLDTETVRIDRMLATGNRLQATLQERQNVQRSLILRSTQKPGERRLHPLLGDLPESWPIIPLKRLVPRIGVGVVVDPSSYFAEEGVPFLRGSNITESGIDLRNVRFISASDSKILWRSQLDTGDVVVIRAGYPGRAAVIPEELSGANCASLLVVKRGEHLQPEYLEAYFNSPLGNAYVDSVRYGAAQEQINVSHVVNFMVPVPPTEEQAAIVKQLAQAAGSVHTLHAKLSRQRILLKERRQALITAAVTGQFDVSTASGRNVTENVTEGAAV